MDHHSTDDHTGDLSLDACLELLANHQRRAIVGMFLDHDRSQAPIDEVIAEIIDVEATKTGERPGHDTIAATVYHVHLPKMAEAGILEYDTRHQDIRYMGNPRFEEVYTTIRELE